MKKVVRTLCDDITYLFFNSFVSWIPFWPLRKLFYVLGGMRIGKGSRILRNTRVVKPSGIVIGDRTYINECCFLDGRSQIEIGNDVTIAIYTKIITGGHEINDNLFGYKGDKIVIGDNVAIFANSTILAGAHIQEGCVVCAMSLIKKGVYEKLGVYGGNPAVYLKKRICDLSYKQDYWHPVFR